MTSLAAPRPVFFPSRLPRPSVLSPPPFAPIRIHLLLSLAKRPGLGFSVWSSQSRRRRRRKRGGGEAKWEDDDAFEPAAATTSVDLEAEIYEFMERSAKPRDFPTKQELLDAGRADLVEAIATQGGWLTFGWDLEDKGRGSSGSALAPVQNGDESLEEDSRISQQSLAATSYGSLIADSGDSARPMDSSSGRSMEMEAGNSAGIAGILSRLMNERSLSYATGSREKEVKGRALRRNGEHDPGEKPDGSEGTPDLGKNLFDDFGRNHSKNGTLAKANGTRSSTPDMWRMWSLKRAGFPASEFEAAEIFPYEGRNQLDPNVIPNSSTDDDMRTIAHNVVETGKEQSVPYSDVPESSQNQIHMRLQRLESELKSILNLLKFRNNGVTSDKNEESSLKELHKLSDVLEFQETEIMYAKDKLRSTRAKLAVLEGKRALEIIESQQIMAERQKRLDTAQKALRDLRTTCIVWPTPASEALLTGSFDGWTSKRRMERSSSGIFSLHLKLYPGRYEVMDDLFISRKRTLYIIPYNYCQIWYRSSSSLMVYGRSTRCARLSATMATRITSSSSLDCKNR